MCPPDQKENNAKGKKKKKGEFIHSFLCVCPVCPFPSSLYLSGLYNLNVSVHCVSAHTVGIEREKRQHGRWRDTASLSVHFLFFSFPLFWGSGDCDEDGRWQKQIAPPDKDITIGSLASATLTRERERETIYINKRWRIYLGI